MRATGVSSDLNQYKDQVTELLREFKQRFQILVSQQVLYKRVSFDGTILFIHCYNLYVLRKNVYIFKVEEKLKFPLVCTLWCQFGLSGLLHLAADE